MRWMKRMGALLVCAAVVMALGASGAAGAGGQEIRISYLGPEGTYTEEAAKFFFSEGVFQPRGTVNEAIEDVTAGRAEYAVIPQENTVGGAVVNYIDALMAGENIWVVGEVILPISQTLMGVEGAGIEDIRTVCSHAQGIAQSAQWRREHMPDAEAVEMASTAAAASYVAQTGDMTIAAVAAPGAADLYGLAVLAENVQITDANKTRFYVLGREEWTGGKLTRAVVVAECPASRIDDIIVEIHDMGLEMVTIHDRPEGSRLGTYRYIIEIENGDGVTDDMAKGLAAMDGVRFLGRFDPAEKRKEP